MEAILIIEDDPLSEKLYKIVLRKAGYLLLFEENPELIFKIIKQNRVRLIIMDINLKNTYLNGNKINGIQLYKHMKENISTEIPVLFVTAHQDLSEELVSESYSFNFIFKPITDINLLITKVKYLIENNGKT